MSDIPSTFRLAEPADFDVRVDDATPGVAVRGEVDILTAPLLWERLAPLLPAVKDRFVVDLSETRFMDSMGLGVLVRAHKRLRADDVAGGGEARLVLRGANQQVRKVLEVTGLHRVFDLED